MPHRGEAEATPNCRTRFAQQNGGRQAGALLCGTKRPPHLSARHFFARVRNGHRGNPLLPIFMLRAPDHLLCRANFHHIANIGCGDYRVAVGPFSARPQGECMYIFLVVSGKALGHTRNKVATPFTRMRHWLQACTKSSRLIQFTLASASYCQRSAILSSILPASNVRMGAFCTRLKFSLGS